MTTQAQRDRERGTGFARWAQEADSGEHLFGSLQFADSETLTFGDDNDVTIQWDGTDLDILAAADDTVITVGNGTNDFDLTWYMADANTTVKFDASANTVDFGADDYGVDVTFHGATAGVFWRWDESADTVLRDGGTLFAKAVASGDGGMTVSADGMTADPETDTEAGYIAVDIGGTGYQIPIYAA